MRAMLCAKHTSGQKLLARSVLSAQHGSHYGPAQLDREACVRQTEEHVSHIDFPLILRFARCVMQTLRREQRPIRQPADLHGQM